MPLAPLDPELAEAIVAPTDGSFRLTDHDPTWPGTRELSALTEKQLKKRAKSYLEERRETLSDAQELLYADSRHALLIVFQAMDAAGKDGTIKHVMSGVNPQGCQVTSFKQPSATELAHDFLWRYWQVLPKRGMIGIFNRSYYEEVLVVRVHPELLADGKQDAASSPAFWERRFEDINALEKHLAGSDTHIIKFFLNVSKDEQRQRFLDRLTDKKKMWKFSPNDLTERKLWDRYQAAYSDMIARTSTDWAPWYVIPADNKWLMRGLVSYVIWKRIESLGLSSPKVSAEQKQRLRRALKQLKAE